MAEMNFFTSEEDKTISYDEIALTCEIKAVRRRIQV
jgi:hypothetical protein